MARPRPLSPLDALFLYSETPDAPQHVGSLLRFSTPLDAPADHLAQVHRALRRAGPVLPPWNQRLATPRLQFSPLHAWLPDPGFDIDDHVRRTTVAAPGGDRELETLVGRLHAVPVDLTRPPWELHLIGGLADGGFALFVKVHHALVDGYTLTRTLEKALSTDPDSRDTRMFYDVSLDRHASGGGDRGAGRDIASLLRSSVRDARSTFALSRALTQVALNRRPLVGSLDAPDTLFNRRITRDRQFASQRWPLAQLKRLAKATDTTVNDVVLAACGGGARTYLQERRALPDQPLVAFVPINVRPKGDPGGGNAVGAMLASLGTDVVDPVARLRAVHASTGRAKAQLEGMTKEAVIAYSQALLSPVPWQTWSAVTGLVGQPRTYNVILSNVPGPTEPLYWNGARLDAACPVSIIHHGQALNVTLFSYAGDVHVGFTGCGDTVPDLRRLATCTGQALTALEAALAVDD